MRLLALFEKPTERATPGVACVRCRGRRTVEDLDDRPLPHGMRGREGRCLDCGATWRNLYGARASGRP